MAHTDTMIAAHDTITPGPGVPGVLYIDPDLIRRHVDSAVQGLVRDSVEIMMNDESWITKIEQMVTVDLLSRLQDRISGLDINAAVATNIDAALDRYRDRALQQNFASRGIADQASQCELVVSDGAVVAQSGLACQDLLVDQSITTRDLKVNNLAVTGTVNTDCAAWNELAEHIATAAEQRLGASWRQTLVGQVLDLAREQGIDFASITVQGRPLVDGHELNSRVTHSNLQRLGVLQALEVSGPAHFAANTMNVVNQRVGVNTQTPDMALTIWDEEVALSLGKISQDRAWIGSTRNVALDIGVNRKRALSIETDGTVVINTVRLDRWKIAFANAVPNHSGTRGDIVFNHDPKPGSPWAWQCLGGHRWQSLGA